MNTKQLIPVVGVLLLSSSAAALADEHWGGHREGPPAFHASHDRDGFPHDGFRRDGFRRDGFHDARPYWREHGHSVYAPAPRCCPPPSHDRWVPVPQSYPYRHSDYPDRWGRGDAYDRDGATIIFSGHVN